MRIGVLVGKLGISAGGSYTYSMNILNYLEKNNSDYHELFFICGSEEHQILESKFPGRVSSFKPRSPRPLIRGFQYFKSFLQLFFSRKLITVEKIQNWNIFSTVEDLSLDLIWSIEPLGFTFDTPYITTVWDLEHRKKPYFPEVSLYGEWERRESRYSKVLGKATFIVTGTNVGKEEIQHFYRINSERIIVAPFPMHSNANAKSIARDINLIFYPAQFWPHKNHANLVEAFKLATAVEPDLKLLLVGSDRGNQKEIRNLVTKLGLKSNIEFLGTISDLELQSLYQVASLMIFPSFFGPDNLPPLEAISFKCPVAAADQPGSREQFKNGIPLFDPTNVIEMSEIILNRRNLEISNDYREKMLNFTNIESFFGVFEEYLSQYARIAKNFKG